MMKGKVVQIILFFFISFLIGSKYCIGQTSLNDNGTLYNAKLKLSNQRSQLSDHLQLKFSDYVYRDSIKTKTLPKVNSPGPQKSKIHPVRLSLVLGGITIGWLGMHIYYSRTWWKNKVHYFKFDFDTYYARNVDKLSHVYTAALISSSSSIVYEWTGINPTLSMALGATTAVVYETYIEINDGFSPNWGFDWGDMAANFIGAGYPIVQRYVPFFRTIDFKWSFDPAWLEKKLRNYPDLLDDYTSMKFWITFNPHDLLSKKIQKYYPSFLGYGLGVTLQNASHTTGTTNAFKEWFLAFDIDITKLPGNTDFLKALKKILNFYHLPTPGVKITNGTVWYGLLF